MRPVCVTRSFFRSTVQVASRSASVPGTDSKRCSSTATRYCASAAGIFGNELTCAAPSRPSRFCAITSERLSCSGAAQRLRSSSLTWFGPVLTTICGRSTSAGTDTGPTETEMAEAALAPVEAEPESVEAVPEALSA